jgi:hypothetical protein
LKLGPKNQCDGSQRTCNDNPGQRLALVSAKRGSTSEQTLKLLASLAGTKRDARERAPVRDEAPHEKSAATRST